MSLTENHPTSNEAGVNDKVRKWFHELVATLQVHQLTLETDTASKERKDLYNTLIFGKKIEIMSMSRSASSMYFIENIVQDYITEINQRKHLPRKIALDISDAKVFVWAEIADDDEETQDALLLSEARVNAKYLDYGYHITSTIVEASDKMPLPSHYQKIKITS